MKGLKDSLSMLLEKNKENNARFEKIEKELSDANGEIERLTRGFDTKASKSDLIQVDKDVKRLDEKLNQLCDQVNSIQIPTYTGGSDDSMKYQELERTLVLLSEKLNQTQESLSQRMSEINKFMDMIKEDIDKSMEEQERQMLKLLGKTNLCEARLDALEKQSKDTGPIKIISQNSVTSVDQDGKDALRGLKDLEARFKAFKDGNQKFKFHFGTLIYSCLACQKENI